MTRPRQQLIALDETPYYHIISRCVRRTFLCGTDHHSGRNYSHRQQWIEDRLRLLSSLFTIDICSYAIMSNHYHLVVKLAPHQADDWSMDDIIQRWTSLYKGPLLVQCYLANFSLSPAELRTLNDITAVWKERLTSLSWFMKCLNEPIARAANKEDCCTGHFWEARFKSQALMTEEALLACMAYVDLNPIRASVAKTPETSTHTSIKERIAPTFNVAEAVGTQIQQGYLRHFNSVVKPLLAFEEILNTTTQHGIPFTYHDYLTLVDWTGRSIRDDKRGAIPYHLPPILKRLNITPKAWLQKSTQFDRCHAKQRNQRPPPIFETG